jgi:serine/threonine-protein kinase
MEFLEGKTLRAMMRDGGVSIPAALKIANNIADGLAAAHAKGVVHRDIKPENIMITKEGMAKIADFGIAKSSVQVQRPEEQTISGTVAYMSPEQLQGEPIDARTDIWSLGVILYEMTTGRRPFAAEYDQATIYAILHEPAGPVSGGKSKVPAKLKEILNRCMEKSPDLRYPSAGALASDIHAVRRELEAASSPSAQSIAILPFADLSVEKDNTYISDGLTEEIITSLSRLRLARVISRATVVSYSRADKTMKQIGDELGAQYILEGSVRKSGAQIRITAQLIDAKKDSYLWADKYDGTLSEIFEIQERVAAKIVKALKMRLTPTQEKKLKKRPTENAEAYQLYLRGRFFWNKRSKESLLTAIRYFEEAIQKDAKYARAWAGIADSYNLLSEYGGISRKETSPKALAAAHKALEFDNNLAEAHASLACLQMLSEWDWPNAEKEFKRAIRLDPNYATAHHWYSEWLLFMGRREEANREISRAVELDPISPALLKDKGIMLYYIQDFDGAIEYGKKTLDLMPDFASAHRLLSLAYVAKGMFDEALDANDRWGELSGNELETLLGRAWCLAAGGRRDEANEIIRGIDPGKLVDGNVMRGIALVHAELGEEERALDWLEKAYGIRAEAVSSILIDPKFEKLKKHPRFIALAKRMGL